VTFGDDEAKTESWTVVVAAAWNVRIFSPDWVSKQLLGNVPITIEVPIAPGAALARYTAEGVVLVPSDDKLIVGVQRTTLPSLSRAEDVARKVLELLPHTPVTATGVNFAFDDAEPGDRLRALFRLSDLDFLSRSGYKIKRTNLTRTLEIQDGVLNATHVMDSDGHAEVHLNFHYQTTSAGAAAELLHGKFAGCLEAARAFLSNVYDSEVEEDEHDEAASYS
jgi:hypothetical protein